ncbi:conserved hypothetical protein [Ricinus communis]|uniref:Uncharacterized protein n=1 Tax=Ricinus communis TaxID=3988 RepID=B9T5F2_RICCO|nr:conserved hypothetical protein [Ricinus communis]
MSKPHGRKGKSVIRSSTPTRMRKAQEGSSTSVPMSTSVLTSANVPSTFDCLDNIISYSRKRSRSTYIPDLGKQPSRGYGVYTNIGTRHVVVVKLSRYYILLLIFIICAATNILSIFSLRPVLKE